MLPRILSARNQSVSDFNSTVNFIDSLNLYNGQIRPFSTVNRNNDNTNEFDDGSEKKVGRPSLGDDVENDNTANSLDLGTNVSDIKNFSTKEKKCIKCGKDIDTESAILCDECLSEMYESRVEELMNQ